MQKKDKLKLSFMGMKGLPPDMPGAGGGERETDAKTRRLVARGHDVTVYCRKNYLPEDFPDTYEGINLVKLPALARPGFQMLSHTFVATLHALFKNRADVVSLHGMGNALFLPFYKLSGTRVVVYMDGVDWERPKWGKAARLLLKWGAASALMFADAVYVDNQVSQERFEQIFGKKPLLITLAADIWEPSGDELLSAFGLTANNYILFVGMLRPDKGVHLLIEAYSKLETDVPLVIVGENPDNPAYVQSLKDKSNANVKFLGYQYGMAARQLFSNCLIYVQPSIIEGNSPALMSAMACGRCVVVNGIPQNRETIGDAGLAFSAGDAVDLCVQLEKLLHDPQLIEELGQKAAKRIAKVYNWERVVDELEALYLKICGRSRQL